MHVQTVTITYDIPIIDCSTINFFYCHYYCLLFFPGQFNALIQYESITEAVKARDVSHFPF